MRELATNKINAAIILVISCLILLSVYCLEYIYGYAPCELCIKERIPYIAAIPVAIFALIYNKSTKPGVFKWLMAICALLFLVNIGISVFHLGIEWRWWQGPSSCSIGAGWQKQYGLSLLQQLDQGSHIVLCNTPALKILNISLAGWNLITSLVLMLIALITSLKR